MRLPKRLEKLISILLMLYICVFGIQLEQHQQYAFFAWEEEGEIPAGNQIDQRIFNLDNELFCATGIDTLHGNMVRAAVNAKKVNVQRSTFHTGISTTSDLAYTAAVQRMTCTMRMSHIPDVHRFIISYIYHQNGEKHSDSSYFPV